MRFLFNESWKMRLNKFKPSIWKSLRWLFKRFFFPLQHRSLCALHTLARSFLFLSHYENYWHNRFRIFKLFFSLFSCNHGVGGVSMCIILHSTSFANEKKIWIFFFVDVVISSLLCLTKAVGNKSTNEKGLGLVFGDGDGAIFR